MIEPDAGATRLYAVGQARQVRCLSGLVVYERTTMGTASITIIGNVGKNPELRDAGQSKVASFSVATNTREKVNGEWTDLPSWWRVSIFGKRAEFVAEHVKNGSSVVVVGTPKIREYEKDGQKRTSVEVLAWDVQFAGSKREAGGESPAPRQQRRDHQTNNQPPIDEAPF